MQVGEVFRKQIKWPTMNLSCIHCGREFSISAHQLGGRGRCPHCQGEIQLPRAESASDAGPVIYQPTNWLDNSMSALGSFVFHLVLLLVLAFIQFGGSGLQGNGEDVFIGTVPGTQLSENEEGELTSEDAKQETESERLNDPVDEIEPPTDPSDDGTLASDLLASPRPSGGASSDFTLGAPSFGGGAEGGGNWDGMIQSLRRNGLDVVIAFDSTSSMRGEIEEVKSQIKRIGNTLVTLVPKARISLCTYRDEGDDYVVKGLPLTSDIQEIDSYLADIFANGGGDSPEAVQEGLRWAVENNKFRRRARKVILLFGDAPPHLQDLKTCLEIASDFSSQQEGFVSTVTCHLSTPLKEFVDIAQAGGGEAFLTRDERQIVTQLMVLVFGSKYRDKVIDAFKLLEK